MIFELVVGEVILAKQLLDIYERYKIAKTIYIHKHHKEKNSQESLSPNIKRKTLTFCNFPFFGFANFS
jgi:hypothetical protein